MASTNMSGRPRGIAAHARSHSSAGLAALDLSERHALLDQVLDAIADDRAHVAVVGEVGEIADPAVSADEHRAAFGAELGDRHVDQAIQRREHTLNAAALLEIDLRKRRHPEQSPVAKTSDRRKLTMLSPSVVAAGA